MVLSLVAWAAAISWQEWAVMAWASRQTPWAPWAVWAMPVGGMIGAAGAGAMITGHGCVETLLLSLLKAKLCSARPEHFAMALMGGSCCATGKESLSKERKVTTCGRSVYGQVKAALGNLPSKSDHSRFFNCICHVLMLQNSSRFM